MTKLEAIKYLVIHNVYKDEWSGAGMFEAVIKVIGKCGEITEKYLNKLLKEAEKR